MVHLSFGIESVMYNKDIWIWYIYVYVCVLLFIYLFILLLIFVVANVAYPAWM